MSEFTVDRELIENALGRTCDQVEDAIREDYSGRYMYGEACLGVVLAGIAEYTQFVIAMAEEVTFESGDLGDLEWMDRVRTDSMGLSTIFYFPGVKIGEAT